MQSNSLHLLFTINSNSIVFISKVKVLFYLKDHCAEIL